MMIGALTVLLLVLAPFTFTIAADARNTPYTPPVVNVDMDGPPESRWAAALDTVLVYHPWENSFGPVFAFINQTLMNTLPAFVFPTVANALQTHWPIQAAELSGLATHFAHHNHPEITYEYLAVWAYYHALSHADFGGGSAYARRQQAQTKSPHHNIMFRECTGVLAVGANGYVTHGRNMDNEPAQLRNLTLHLRLRVGGLPMADAMGWYWSGSGFMTMYSPGIVSLEENWRKQFRDYNGTMILSRIAAGAISENWIFREAFFTQKLRVFADILNYTSTVPLAGPMYGIMAGAGKYEGAVVTRDPLTTYPAITLANQTGTDKWFIVQTNYDHWDVDPLDDPRRTLAENKLRQLGQPTASMVQGMLDVMQTREVLNPDTVFTAIMRPATGEALWIGQNLDG